MLLPVLAHRTDLVTRRATYLTAVGVTALVGFPIAAGLAGAADQVIRGAPRTRLGTERAGAAFAGARRLGSGNRRDRGTPLRRDWTGRIGLFAWGHLSSLVTVGSFVVGLPYGITGVAAAYALASLPPARAPPRLRCRSSTPRSRMSYDVWRRRLRPAAFGGLVAYGLGLVLVGRLPVLVLALQVAGLTGAYVAGLWIMDRRSVRMIRDVARRGAPS